MHILCTYLGISPGKIYLILTKKKKKDDVSNIIIAYVKTDVENEEDLPNHTDAIVLNPVPESNLIPVSVSKHPASNCFTAKAVENPLKRITL